MSQLGTLHLTPRGLDAVFNGMAIPLGEGVLLCALPVTHVFVARNLETGEETIVLTGPQPKRNESPMAPDETEV